MSIWMSPEAYGPFLTPPPPAKPNLNASVAETFELYQQRGFSPRTACAAVADDLATELGTALAILIDYGVPTSRLIPAINASVGRSLNGC